MSKLPSVSSKRLIQVLYKVGFSRHQETGSSHLVFSHADGRRTTVPRHGSRDIPKGTLRAILRDINISPEEFAKLL